MSDEDGAVAAGGDIYKVLFSICHGDVPEGMSEELRDALVAWIENGRAAIAAANHRENELLKLLEQFEAAFDPDDYGHGAFEHVFIAFRQFKAKGEQT